MAKGVIKEIIIILLLMLAVILLLGVLLYDYVPLNKVIPEKITYTATDEIKQALQEQQEVDDGQVVLTYEVTATDLNNYKRINEYKAGRKNPFATGISTSTDNSTSGTTSQNNNSSSSSSSGKTNSSTSATGTNNSSSTNYYPDKGTK